MAALDGEVGVLEQRLETWHRDTPASQWVAAIPAFTLKGPLRLSWKALYQQFGVDPSKAEDHVTVYKFRKDCLRELTKIKIAWPALTYRVARGVVVVYPTPPQIAPAETDSAG